MKKNRENGPSGSRVILTAILTGILVAAAFPCALMLLVGGIDLWHAIIADMVIDPKAAEYIQQNYPDHDFELEEAYYAFKDDTYVVEVWSRSSQDTHFALTYNGQTHELRGDSYTRDVLGGWNTFCRLVQEYDALVQDAVGVMPGISYLNGSFCRCSIGDTYIVYSTPEGLDMDTLVPDRKYDVAAIGSEFGYPEIEIVEREENIHIDRALEYLLEIDRLLSENGIGYRGITLRLIDETYPNTTVEFEICDVTGKDLHSEDPLARLQELWDAQEAKRQEIKASYEQNDADDS